MVKISKKLRNYIEDNVFPIYRKNEQGHNLDHIRYVINRSFRFAVTIPGINYDIVYAVAAYHDIGHHINPEKHELISAEMMYDDDNLRVFFNDEERRIIKEAIEDHRASCSHKPRSIYGQVVSTADRNNNVKICLMRSYIYKKKLYPERSDEKIFEDCYQHLRDKFGKNGYARFFFEDEDYEKFLREIRELLLDKNKFIAMQKDYVGKLKLSGELK